jgi:hypothetical protein
MQCLGKIVAELAQVQLHTIEYPKYRSLPVIPAKAGIQTWSQNLWPPASAGVTEQRIGHFIE